MAMVGGQNECIMAVNNDPDRWAPTGSETQRKCGGGMGWAGFDGPSKGFGPRRERREGEGMLGWVGWERGREEVFLTQISFELIHFEFKTNLNLGVTSLHFKLL